MDGRKKILFVITKSVLLGAQKYVLDVATHAAKTYDVAVAAGGDGELMTALRRAHVRTISLLRIERDINPLTDVRAFFEMCSLIRRERPDTLHLNSSKAALHGALAGRLFGVRCIVFTVHGWPFREDRGFLWKLVIWIGSYITALFSHEVICISRFDTKNIRMPFVKKKIHVIHNGVASFKLLDRQEARRQLFGADEQKRHVEELWMCSTGELTQNKNYFFAIDAVVAHNKKHPGSKIYYAILGGGEDREALVAHIEKVGASSFVKLLGHVPEARAHLFAFDLFFMPSKKEGLPYAVLEAGMASLPVIASRVGGIPEILENEKYGLLIDPFDIDQTVAALGEVALSSDKRREMGRALKERVVSVFSKERMLEETEALY